MHAIIDIGSNTIRLAVYKVENEKLTLLLNKKSTAGLASYMKNGEMMPEGINKACEVLDDFRFLLDHFKIFNVFAFATAALRNVSNSKEAVDEITERTGIPITVLLGNEEATLDFVGAMHTVKGRDGLLIDIGGASTELVVYENGMILKTLSMPIGSLNIYNQYVGRLLPNREERKQIKQAVLEELNRSPEINHGQYAMICGVGGTVRAAGKLNNHLFNLPASNTVIKVPNVKKMVKLMENDEEEDVISSETLDILLKVVPDRVRTVLPGMIILNTLVKHFGGETIFISASGVREGYLYDRVLKGNLGEKAAVCHA